MRKDDQVHIDALLNYKNKYYLQKYKCGETYNTEVYTGFYLINSEYFESK